MAPFQIGERLDALIVGLVDGLEAVQNLQSAPLTGNDCPFNDAFHLPHVAGPGVFLKSAQGFLGDTGDLLTGFPVEFGEKMVDQQRNIFLMLAQWRNGDREDT